MASSRIIWDHLGSSGIIFWAHLGSSGIIWAHLGSSGIIWDHLGSAGVICHHLGSSELIWEENRKFHEMFLSVRVTKSCKWQQMGAATWPTGKGHHHCPSLKTARACIAESYLWNDGVPTRRQEVLNAPWQILRATPSGWAGLLGLLVADVWVICFSA